MPMRSELRYLIGRLGTEVLDLQQVLMAEAHQVGGIDLCTLEAVVGPHGQVELLGESELLQKAQAPSRALPPW